MLSLHGDLLSGSFDAKNGINPSLPSVKKEEEDYIDIVHHRVMELEQATNKAQPRYITRNGHQIKIPIKVGPKRGSIWSKLVKCWNELATELKT